MPHLVYKVSFTSFNSYTMPSKAEAYSAGKLLELPTNIRQTLKIAWNNLASTSVLKTKSLVTSVTSIFYYFLSSCATGGIQTLNLRPISRVFCHCAINGLHY